VAAKGAQVAENSFAAEGSTKGRLVLQRVGELHVHGRIQPYNRREGASDYPF
jgi:hypothetical protein